MCLYALSIIVPVCIGSVVAYYGLCIRRIRARTSLTPCKDVSYRAEVRAWRLLLSYLSPGQRAMFLEFGYFDMRGSRGRAQYRVVEYIGAYNIFEYNREGIVVARYCLRSQRTDIPRADRLLTVISLLATDEGRFWREANKSYSYHRNIHCLPDFEVVYGRWFNSSGKVPPELEKAASQR